MQLDLCSNEFLTTDEIKFPQGITLHFPPISLNLANRYIEALGKQAKAKDKNPKAFTKATLEIQACLMEYLNTNTENITINQEYLEKELKLNIKQVQKLPVVLMELISGIEKK